MIRQRATVAAGFVAAFVTAMTCSTIPGSMIPGPAPAAAADIIVGTGQLTTEHYRTGRTICRHFRKSASGASCEVRRFEGRDAAEPLAVLGNVLSGAVEIGIVASDWHYEAVKKAGRVAHMDVDFGNLRALFSLQSQAFTVVARRDAGIATLADLANKRVNIGAPGSDARRTMEKVMQAMKWLPGAFQLADELGATEQSLALCHNRIQAGVWTVAHPNAAIAQTQRLCAATLVPLADGVIKKLIAAHPYFSETAIPGAKGGIASFGATVTAVGSAEMDPDLAHAVVKAVFDNIEEIKRTVPSLENVSPARMVRDGLTAPLHPGALRYYREKGLS